MSRSARVRDADAVEAVVAEQRLLRAGGPVVVLLSGGRDSVCLLDLAVRIAGGDRVRALHVDYGLRESAGGDAALCRELCDRLGVPLTVHRPGAPPAGNLQAWARDERYAAAVRMAREGDAAVAAGHTADDQVETVLYRLAASPGRRALLGMRPRAGRVVRPLLTLTRAETGAYCAQRGLPFRDDPTNSDPAYARNRIRRALIPAWRGIHPAAERNLLETIGVLRDEADVLDAVVGQALAAAGDPPSVERLAALEPALARLAVQALADRAMGGRAPAIAARAPELLALGRRGGSARLDLPGGLRAEVTYGVLRMHAGPRPAPPPPAPMRLPVPGRVEFAGGIVSSERGRFPVADGTLDARALAPPLEVRPWRRGDRMRPLGLAGSKSVGDLFTDGRVPRAERGRLPVVVSAGEIAWIPGVATGEAFRVRERSDERVRLSWAPAQYD